MTQAESSYSVFVCRVPSSVGANNEGVYYHAVTFFLRNGGDTSVLDLLSALVLWNVSYLFSNWVATLIMQQVCSTSLTMTKSERRLLILRTPLFLHTVVPASVPYTFSCLLRTASCRFVIKGIFVLQCQRTCGRVSFSCLPMRHCLFPLSYLLFPFSGT